MSQNPTFKQKFLILAIFFCLSCGYHFVGESEIVFPNNAQKIALIQVINPTQYDYLPKEVKNFLNEEMVRQSRARLVARDKADLFLSVVLSQVEVGVKVTQENDSTGKYLAKVALFLVFSTPQGKEIKRTLPVSYTQTYEKSSEQKDALIKASQEALRLALRQLKSYEF